MVQGASSALRACARPSGRTVMLLLSGGWPAAGLGAGPAAALQPAVAPHHHAVDGAFLASAPEPASATVNPAEASARAATFRTCW